MFVCVLVFKLQMCVLFYSDILPKIITPVLKVSLLLGRYGGGSSKGALAMAKCASCWLFRLACLSLLLLFGCMMKMSSKPQKSVVKNPYNIHIPYWQYSVRSVVQFNAFSYLLFSSMVTRYFFLWCRFAGLIVTVSTLYRQVPYPTYTFQVK